MAPSKMVRSHPWPGAGGKAPNNQQDQRRRAQLSLWKASGKREQAGQLRRKRGAWEGRQQLRVGEGCSSWGGGGESS